MSKILVLAIDRDDDFGFKGYVETPVIGIEAAERAVLSLGRADPEDSDVNALLAAINIYDDLLRDGKDVEIALVCGDQVVSSSKSDQILKDELINVLDIVGPDSVVLTYDGAEDEGISSIVSSRVPIDSTRKVYVKQAPGVEGSFYIFKKMLSDPQKRRRFLVPFGALLTAIALIFIIVDLYAFSMTTSTSYLISMSWPFVVFLVGILFLLYGYNMTDRLVDYFDNWQKQIRGSNVSMTFTVLSVAMFVVGIVLAVFSIKDITSNGVMYVILVFLTNIIWPFTFGIFFSDLGTALDDYMENRRIGRSFMTKSIMVFGIAFIMQGMIDFIKTYVGYILFDNGTILAEIIAGVLLTLMASLISASYKKYYHSQRQT